MGEKLEAFGPAFNLLKLSPFMGWASRWVVPMAATTSQFWTKKLPAQTASQEGMGAHPVSKGNAMGGPSLQHN